MSATDAVASIRSIADMSSPAVAETLRIVADRINGGAACDAQASLLSIRLGRMLMLASTSADDIAAVHLAIETLS